MKNKLRVNKTLNTSSLIGRLQDGISTYQFDMELPIHLIFVKYSCQKYFREKTYKHLLKRYLPQSDYNTESTLEFI